MRLGDDVRPLAYELSLTLDARQGGAAGHVEIDIDVKRPLDFFWINGRRLAIGKAQVTVAGRVLPASVTTAGDDFIGLAFGQPLPQGRARLAIDYTAPVTTKDTLGIFRQQDLGEWYAFTQFESDSARRAMPCFDEPQWKTPWTVTLTVPREHVAVSNTPVAAERELPGGMKEVRFARTLPLPTYLVAFAAGPFDVVDGGTAGQKKTPLRYIVPKGRGAQVAYARQATPRLLELLEDYFGLPYPFEKLDSVAIPVTVAFGAMENPGMITYKSSLLAARPGMADERFQERYASVAAHEMAHQWFGDLVTMQWWDDIWLNESFATWMARKIVPRFQPGWETASRRQHERYEAFELDRLAAARQVRQPVNTVADLGNAFDRITYQKGGAVLSMFEDWLGEAAFRDGVRAYLKDHAFGNATALDFFAALSKTDPAIARAFSSFVMQPGLPLVDVELDCKGAQPAVVLRQQRLLPAQPGTPPQQRWLVPVCLRHEGGEGATCTLLQEDTQRVVLPKAAHCPGWVVPNPGGKGYYLWRLDARSLQALPGASLRPEEAQALAADETLLAKSGVLRHAYVLALAASLASSDHPEVVTAAATAVEEVAKDLDGTEGRASLANWVRAHFAARAAQLGWLPRPGDSDAVLKLRAKLLPLVTDVASDAALKSQARSLALAWLGGERRSLGSAYRAVLLTAARDADPAVVDAFIAAARQANDGATRTDIYTALGHVRDPQLRRRAFEHALMEAADLRESEDAFQSAGEEPASADALLAFVREHHAEFVARLPEESVARMPRWHGDLCSAAGHDAVQSLYGSSTVRGIQRNLAQTVETIAVCVRNRAFQAAEH
jgi:alanyl aminopeptidase